MLFCKDAICRPLKESYVVMSNEDSFVYPVLSTISHQQLTAIMMELSQRVVAVHHVDEMFFWLARIISQHLDVAVVEFWTKQANSIGDFSLDLRAVACQGGEVPERLIANDAVRMIIEGIHHDHRGFWLKSVVDLFTPYQATLLSRYGLGYCSSYLLKSAALLPPQKNDFSAGKIATPLVLGVLLFLEHPPSQRLLLGIGHILERALTVAKKQGLLFATENGEAITTSSNHAPLQQQPPLRLADLVPRHARSTNKNTNSAKMGNLDEELAELPNRQTRQVYAAIDGQRTVAELASFTHLSIEEIRASIRILTLRHRVRLYEPGGLLVDSACYLNQC
jgi:hypothetical protein